MPSPLSTLMAWVLLAPYAAMAGWQDLGPERGHVIDAAASADTVWVSTRAGVMRAAGAMDAWERDARFPRDTRQLAVAVDGQPWASPGQSIWRAGDGAERVQALGSGSLVVDLVPAPDGGVVALVRGDERGVLALLPRDAGGHEAVWGLRERDPWAAASTSERVWVATVDGELWVSDDAARSFDEHDAPAPVDAGGGGGGRPVAARADGRVGDLASGDELGAMPGARFVAIADDGGAPLLVSTGGAPGLASVVRLVDGAAVPVDLAAFEDTIGMLTPTRAWTVPGHGSVLGTFREGPIHIDGGIARAARDGFRATMTGGAAMNSAGELLLALMGTGSYLSPDDGDSWQQEEGGDAPVTDAVEVLALGERFAVLDFDGLTVRSPDGVWTRWPYPGELQPGQNQGLVDLAPGPDGSTWAIDANGGVWQHASGAWRRCAASGAIELDGDGERTWLLGRTGLRELGACEQQPGEAWSGSATLHSTGTDGLALPWAAVGGVVWKDGERIAQLPLPRVAAIGGSADRVLVALEDGAVLGCDDAGCTPAAENAPAYIRALGWTADDRVWAAERRGTLLVSGGQTSPAGWHLPGGEPVPDGQLMRLEAPHWLAIQQPHPPGGHGPAAGGPPGPHAGPPGGHPHGPPHPGGEPPTPPQPPAEPQDGPGWWLPVVALLGVALIGALGWAWARRRRS